MLISDLCDYSEGYIAVKETITTEGTNDANKKKQQLIFKNNASIRSCISKINNSFIGSAEDLDIIMPMYFLQEYSDNYSMISGSLYNYYRFEVNAFANENNADNYMTNNNKTIISRPFEYKTKIVGGKPDIIIH